MAKFDCTVPEHASICEAQLITGYPTFVFYIDGERFPHTGERNMEMFLRTATRARLGMLDYDEGEEDRDELAPSFGIPEDKKSDPYDEL